MHLLNVCMCFFFVVAGFKLKDFLRDNETLSEFLEQNATLSKHAVQQIVDADINLEKVSAVLNTSRSRSHCSHWEKKTL